MVEIAGVRSVNSSAVNGVEPAGAAVRLTMALSGLVLVLMMICGLWLRMSQGGILNMDPAPFYQVMTVHGVSMVGIAGLTGAAMMWFFRARHVQLTGWVYWLMLVLVLLGVAFILGAIFLGGFAGAWTFLYPLPAHSAGVWEPVAAAAFLVGLASVGVGFLVYYLETGRAIIARYGNFSKALGWPLLFGGSQTEVPPPTVVASAAVTVFNGIGIVIGAAVLSIILINLYVPSFAIDPLLAKNMIFFFGHVFINASIYMSVIAVYEILPSYAGREWKASKPFLWGWTASTLLVLIALDFARRDRIRCV